jgi:predicted membrane channel-forming protein YqfA (hemolysin III family)
MAKLSAFTKNNLNKQGFGKLDDEAKSRYELPLRFSPGVGTILIVIGLVLQSPIWLGSMALVALSGALFPKGMLYNLGIRHLFHALPLPSTPKPRRFSYILSTVLLAGSAYSFYFGLAVLGFILGGMVVIGGTILTTSLWCLGSWYYRLFFRHVKAE